VSESERASERQRQGQRQKQRQREKERESVRVCVCVCACVFFAKETCNFKEPTNRSYPLPVVPCPQAEEMWNKIIATAGISFSVLFPVTGFLRERDSQITSKVLMLPII